MFTLRSKSDVIRRGLLALLLCAFSLTAASADDLDDARAAYQAGDYETAIGLLMPLAEEGDAAAQFAVAVCYARGQGVEQNETEGRRWLQSAAENGFARAQYELGLIYEEGRDVEPSEEEAYKWYALAAEQGDTDAAWKIRRYTRFKMPFDEALKLAGQDDDEAKFILGSMYLNGDVVKQDFEEAIRWFKASFENPWAMGSEGKIALGIMRHNGLGLTQDYVQAFYLFEEAANIGNPFDVYNFEQEPISLLKARPDLNQSVVWFKQAAQDDDAGAQFCLAVAYFRGVVVEKDFKQTINWLKKSAEGGNARGQYYLGSMYSSGEGVRKSEKKAAYWYEKAALQEYADAQTALGVSYYGGSGVKKNIEKAKYWLRKAIENGDTEAAEFWGWFELGEFDPGRLAGTFENGVYTAPDGRFKARYRLSGASERDPCCDQTVDDAYYPNGFGILSMSNEYGAINGVIYGPVGMLDELSVEAQTAPLQRWFHGVVMDVLSSGAGVPTILHEEGRQFHEMSAWVAAVSIPGGGVIEHYSSETGEQGRVASVRGFVVFQRDDFIYALMCESNVLSFAGESRLYDPGNWSKFVDELSAFYDTMEFRNP